MNHESCCRRLGPNDPSPFEILQLGWYDGLTSGLARCRACAATYFFQLLEWDGEREARVYGFQEINSTGYESVANLMQRGPQSTEGHPGYDDSVSRAVSAALGSGFEWSLYIASANLSDKIIAARKLTFDEWMAILGLSAYRR